MVHVHLHVCRIVTIQLGGDACRMGFVANGEVLGP